MLMMEAKQYDSRTYLRKESKETLLDVTNALWSITNYKTVILKT